MANINIENEFGVAIHPEAEAALEQWASARSGASLKVAHIIPLVGLQGDDVGRLVVRASVCICDGVVSTTVTSVAEWSLDAEGAVTGDLRKLVHY